MKMPSRIGFVTIPSTVFLTRDCLSALCVCVSCAVVISTITAKILYSGTDPIIISAAIAVWPSP